jgi:hypothetical protein
MIMPRGLPDMNEQATFWSKRFGGDDFVVSLYQPFFNTLGRAVQKKGGHVGVCEVLDVLRPAVLKRYALLFDQIHYVTEDVPLSSSFKSITTRDEIEFLVDQNFLVPIHHPEILNKINDYAALRKAERGVTRRLKRRYLGKEISYERARELAEYLSKETNRYTAIFLRHHGIDATCIGNVFHTSDKTNDGDLSVDKEDIYEIIVNGIDIPEEYVPWQDILSFRQEPSSQQQLRRLRLWVSDIAKGNLTLPEATDKIEYLKQEFRENIKGAELGFRTSTIRTLIVAGAEFVENILKLKLTSLAEAPFKILDARAKLLKGEREAVGRELQYLIRAADTFAR